MDAASSKSPPIGPNLSLSDAFPIREAVIRPATIPASKITPATSHCWYGRIERRPIAIPIAKAVIPSAIAARKVTFESV